MHNLLRNKEIVGCCQSLDCHFSFVHVHSAKSHLHEIPISFLSTVLLTSNYVVDMDTRHSYTELPLYRHYLVIPKEHIPTVRNLQRRAEDYSLGNVAFGDCISFMSFLFKERERRGQWGGEACP